MSESNFRIIKRGNYYYVERRYRSILTLWQRVWVNAFTDCDGDGAEFSSMEKAEYALKIHYGIPGGFPDGLTNGVVKEF